MESDTAMVLMMIGTIILVIIAILWILLPFAVFGIKDRLDKLLDEIKRTNAQLAYQSARLKDIQNGAVEPDDETSRSALREVAEDEV